MSITYENDIDFDHMSITYENDFDCDRTSLSIQQAATTRIF